MPTGDPPFWPMNPYVQTFGPHCPICGDDVVNAVGHGWGICKRPEAKTTHYVGTSPDQVRQIVREELEAMFKKYGTPTREQS